ncbi:hypothetical protein HanXRQr2_Chr16g0733841 [Helianthus annuus]|uniref:Uncharacterized protein n=1 Tax=Helianthus annuus TaxID=4232 RepID=A0A9K3DR36_HELAN|nr:hypothetical protein HanXRQr2_Chr16g0733841 [Helianthus annuus]KAJ0820107.1 hypothetical protein HanPSC8_Chr16g0703931 [Helianthus annuus]
MAKKFSRFNASELAAQARYDVLRTRPEENPRQVCMDTLEAVNQIDRFNNIVTGPLRATLCVTPQPMAESSGRGTERNRLSRSFHNNYYYKFS